MAQSQSNTVKFGVNTRTPSFPAPSFKTKTSTPSMLRSNTTSRAFPALGALGVQPASSGIPPKPITGALPRTSVSSNPTGAPQVSTSTPQYGSAGTGIQSQLDGIRSGIAGAQGLLDQRKAAEATQTNTGRKNVASDGTVTFKGILDSLLGASKPTSEQERTRKEMERIAAGNKAIADEAKRTSDMYGQEIARVGNLKAGAVAGNLSTGSQVVGSGNANLAANAATTRMDALAAAQKAALEGTSQQLTGQEQQAQAFRPSLDAALTQQQLGISGIGTAANLASPVVAPYGQTSFDPLTPGFAGGNMNPQTQAANIAQQLMSGQMTYEQAVEAMQYAGTAGTNFLNQALSGMGANPLQLQAQGTASQTNMQTAGTAQTGIAREGLGNAIQTYVDMTSRSQVAHDQANRVMGILNQTGLNNVSSTDYNKALNTIKGRFSDTDLASLQTAMTEAQIAYMNLLQTGGGTPSGQEMAAISTLDISKSAGAINASIRELEAAVANKLQAQQGAMNAYQSNLGGGGGFTGGGGNSFAEQW